MGALLAFLDATLKSKEINKTKKSHAQTIQV